MHRRGKEKATHAMSAFIVSNHHIDALVYARELCARDLRTWPDKTPTEVGRALLRENMASTAARYPKHADMQVDETAIEAYAYHAPAPYTLPIVQLLKALDCYEYQACEHDGWVDSSARALCHGLRRLLIQRLPGYADAAYEITSRTVVVTTRARA
jgi:hypothetical protein